MAINSLSAASYGLSGLVSGINSQDMVEKLLSGTQAKIDKASQRKVTLQNKQQMYRDVAAKLKSLQTGFLSFTSATNLRSNAFYNTMSAVITPPKGSSAAFSVTASANATVGNVSMDYIKQLAQSYAKTTTFDATGKVEGSFDSKVAENLLSGYRGADATLTIQVGDDEITIANAPETFEGMTGQQVAEYLNTTGNLGSIGAEARYINNKLNIISNDSDKYVTVHGNQANDAKDKTLAMQMFGNYGSLGEKGTFSFAVDTDLYRPSFVVNLDGRQQTVRVGLSDLQDFVDTGDATKLADSLSDSLRRVFGTGVTVEKITNVTDGPVVGLRLAAGSASQKFTVTGSNTVLNVFGLDSGISNKLNSGTALKDLNFAAALQGNQHSFTINGVGFSFTADTALSTIMNEINNSKAGVKISYLESQDRFMIENVESGVGNDQIEWAQTEGNFLSVLFGEAGSGSTTTFPVNKTLVGGQEDIDDIMANIGKGGSFTFNVNGRDYTFTLKEKKDKTPYTAEEFATEMDKAFKSSFGTMTDGEQAVDFIYNDVDKRFEIIANDKEFVVKASPYDKDKNKFSLGFEEGDSTRVTKGGVTLAEAGVKFGGGSIEIDLGSYGTVSIAGTDLDGLDMDGVANKLQTEIRAALTAGGYANASSVSFEYDEKATGFKIMGIDIPMEIVVMADNDSTSLTNLFGTDKLVMAAPAFEHTNPSDPLFDVRHGQNAIFSLNGAEIQRASNSFTIDGLTYTLYNTTYKDPTNIPQNPTVSDFEQATQISISRDTEQIVEGVKEFLKLYNETVDYINELYKAEATYKDYAPLTAAQKSSMSDREIELWEEKSKEGLLRNDQYLGTILQDLRSALFTKPESSTFAIYDFGVSTSYYASDGNFVETSDGALKAAIENDPEAFRKLFAGDDGLMETLNKAIDKAAYASYASPGTLVALAGSNTLDTSSSIYKQIREVDSQLTTLESKYWNEYDRYWKQFNAMEQLIQQMNTQSSWLSQQFSS